MILEECCSLLDQRTERGIIMGFPLQSKLQSGQFQMASETKQYYIIRIMHLQNVVTTYSVKIWLKVSMNPIQV